MLFAGASVDADELGYWQMESHGADHNCAPMSHAQLAAADHRAASASCAYGTPESHRVLFSSIIRSLNKGSVPNLLLCRRVVHAASLLSCFSQVLCSELTHITYLRANGMCPSCPLPIAPFYLIKQSNRMDDNWDGEGCDAS